MEENVFPCENGVTFKRNWFKNLHIHSENRKVLIRLCLNAEIHIDFPFFR